MKILRAFQVINKDGSFAVSATYNEVDDTTGELIRQNAKDSFYAVDDRLKESIEAVEDYIRNERLGG